MMQKKSHEDFQKKISSLQDAVIRYTTAYLKTKIMAKKSSMDKGWELTKQIEKLSGLSSQTHCVEWKVTDNATLYLPSLSKKTDSGTIYRGRYASSDREQEGDTWKCWIYTFLFYENGNSFGDNNVEVSDEQETEDCAIRPFHKLPSAEELYRTIWYTSSDGELVTPYDLANFGGASIVSNEYDEVTGKGCIKFDRNLTSIGNYAFAYNPNLTSMTIPNSITSIGVHAFRDCHKLTSINLPSTLGSIGDYIFEGCSSLMSIMLPDGVTSIGYSAFNGCSSLTSINLPSGLTSIGYKAFYVCSSLTSINLPSGVTSIGNFMFAGCSSLTSVNLPDGVTSIGTSAFFACTNLTSITLPDELETIELLAFANSGLRLIELPSIMTLGYRAFFGCKDLIVIAFKGTEPPTTNFIGAASPFLDAGSIIGGSVLLVPEGSVDKYVEAGYPNVYSVADNWAMQVINTLMNGMTTFSDEELLTIEAGKTKINEATDFATVYDEFIKTISIINLRKAKDADIAQLDNITASLTDKEKATLQAAIDDCKAQINSAKDKVAADKELELTKAKIESIVSLYNLNYSTLTQAEIDDIASRILAATDKDTVISEANAFMYTERELAKQQMPPNIFDGENLLRDYLARIDNSLSISEIKSIVQEAWNYIDSTPKMAIGDISYLLEELTNSDVGIVYNALTDIQLTDAAAIKMPSDAYQIQCLSTTIHYSRTLPEGVWQCWYEPFQTKVNTEKFDAAEIAGILYNDKNEPIVCFRKMANGDMMLPNTIYVIRAKEGCSVLNLDPLLLTTLYGKQLTMQSAFDNYVLGGYYGVQPLPFANKEDKTYYGKDWYTLNDKGQFSLRKATDTLKPQRFWLYVTPRTGSNGYYPIKDTSEAKEFIDFTVLGDEETTGIQEASPKSSPASAELSTGSWKGVIYDLMGRKVTSIQKGQIYIVNGKKYVAK